MGARVIFSSTGGAIYGEGVPIPSSESTLPAPSSPYGRGEVLCRTVRRPVQPAVRHGACRPAVRECIRPAAGTSGEACVVSAFCCQRHRGGTRSRSMAMASRRVTTSTSMTASRPSWRQPTTAKPASGTSAPGSEVNVLDLAELVTGLTGHAASWYSRQRASASYPGARLSGSGPRRISAGGPLPRLSDGVQAMVKWFEAGAPDRASR